MEPWRPKWSQKHVFLRIDLPLIHQKPPPANISKNVKKNNSHQPEGVIYTTEKNLVSLSSSATSSGNPVERWHPCFQQDEETKYWLGRRYKNLQNWELSLNIGVNLDGIIIEYWSFFFIWMIIVLFQII